MIWVENIAFLIYTGALAYSDKKTGTVPLVLILSGAGCGLLLRIAAGIPGEQSLRALLLSYAPGAVWGLLLLIASRTSRRAVGRGDGYCFLSFVFWKDHFTVFRLLFFSVLLLGVFGILLILFRKQKRDLRLPLMPFVWISALFLSVAELLPAVLR